MRTLTDLHSGWRLTLAEAAADTPERVRGASVEATVPGCVHTDLMAAGLLADPYLDRNEDQQRWVGDSDWRYATTLPVDGPAAPSTADRIDLVFDGLDTVAEIRLDGEPVGRTRNQHRGYRFDVTDRLAGGGAHELSVVLRVARRYAERVRDEVGERPGAYPEPLQYIRKTAANFGWDWGPSLLTAGIWRAVRLEHWSTARLARVRPQVRVVDGDTGEVVVHVEVERAGDPATELTVTARVGDVTGSATVPARATSATVRLRVPGVALWWPHDLGDQPRYELAVELAAAGVGLDTWRRRIGFRTVELRTAPDADGTPFAFVVNGREIFVRGANWIPDDCFLSRVDRPRYAARVRQAVDANITLLRVWGGGCYESDDFYDVCDELGVLVWQDFLFACAAYPEEEPLRGEVEAEARDNVVRLMPHPSLVLWNGNNENIWGFHDWDWQPVLAGRSWGWGYYSELLPAVLAELDPTRPYWPGSPYSGDPAGRLHRVPRLAAPVRVRVRLPGTAELGHPDPGDPRRPAAAGLTRHAGPPEGPRRHRQTGPGHGAAPARAPEHRRLALPDAAQPGPGRRRRHRAPAVARSVLRGRGVLAAQRLLAGDLLGGRGRRRPPQTPVVRRPAGLRTAAADRAAPAGRPGGGPGQRRR
ncbi:glycoside hydrolase family 2 protein [Micromonospora zhanjiangensis]